MCVFYIVVCVVTIATTLCIVRCVFPRKNEQQCFVGDFSCADAASFRAAKCYVFRYFDNYVSRENTAGAMKKDSDSKRPAEEAPSGTNIFHICLISLITENVLDPLFRLSFLSIS